MSGRYQRGVDVIQTSQPVMLVGHPVAPKLSTGETVFTYTDLLDLIESCWTTMDRSG
jgi:hypothetical protein